MILHVVASYLLMYHAREKKRKEIRKYPKYSFKWLQMLYTTNSDLLTLLEFLSLQTRYQPNITPDSMHG